MMLQLRSLSVMDVTTVGAHPLRASLPTRILLLTLLLFLEEYCLLDACEFGAPISGPQECVTFKPEDVEDITVNYQLPGHDDLYYRYLLLHKNYLLVGAKNYLFTLDKNNISNQIHESYVRPVGDSDSCQAWGINVDPDCQNHIHFITKNHTYPQSDVVYVCGTGGYEPTGFLYNVTSGSKVAGYGSIYGHAKAICPFDPFDNTTAIYVANRNPGNLPALYSAANVDYTKAGPLIYRGKMYYPNGSVAYDYLRTASKDAKWLNEPQFVGSFEMEDVIYFFFREEALEHSHSCGKKIYSRVARVCKNDKGGPSFIRNQWTSYQKARLNCSIPGKMQYYFDEIQDIQWNPNTRTFYALFTTSSYGVTGSAICVYTRDEIEDAFSGPFQHPSDAGQIPDSDVPNPRPGKCSDIPDSTKVSPSFVTFINEKLLMYYAVQHKFGEPIFVQPNVMLQKLQAHFFSSDNLFFAGSNDGHVYQIYQPTVNISETLTSAVISPLKDSGPVWSLQYDPNFERLYIGYDAMVVQMEMRRLCEKYTKADSCVFNKFCGWYNGHCLEADESSSQLIITYCQLAQKTKMVQGREPKAIWENLLQIYVNGSNPTMKYINQGGLVTLEIRMPLCTTGAVSWHFGETCNNLKKIPKNVHILGADNSLTIRNASLALQGCYAAKDENGQDLAFYHLQVHTDDAEKEDLWTRKFYEWCDEFEDYKNRINVWKNSCSGDHSNTIPQVPGG